MGKLTLSDLAKAIEAGCGFEVKTFDYWAECNSLKCETIGSLIDMLDKGRIRITVKPKEFRLCVRSGAIWEEGDPVKFYDGDKGIPDVKNAIKLRQVIE